MFDCSAKILLRLVIDDRRQKYQTTRMNIVTQYSHICVRWALEIVLYQKSSLY